MTAVSRVAARIALATGALGGAAVIAAWVGASSSPIVKDQAGWGAVGVAGTFGVIAGSILWIVTLRQAVAVRAGALRSAVAAGTDAARPVTVSPPVGGRCDAAERELVAAATMIHYHRAGCRLAAAKPVIPAARAEHEQAGRAPCGVCEP